jgi:hypothetical protein
MDSVGDRNCPFMDQGVVLFLKIVYPVSQQLSPSGDFWKISWVDGRKGGTLYGSIH